MAYFRKAAEQTDKTLNRSRAVHSRAVMEEKILSLWEENSITVQSLQKNQDTSSFVFYEGPPTANGSPGIHHILSRVFKDIYIRFYSQRGFHVPRRAGWDCHGLPVEREVEKELGIRNKAEIENKYGIAQFNQLCRRSVLRYISHWNDFSRRMAFSVNLEDPYFTMDNSYIESVWSILKTIWDQGLIYQGYRVVPLDPVLGASMSDAEVDQGYREVEDPSLTLRFRLKSNNPWGEEVFLLVWTTTPWTLPSNTALAVSSQADYALVEYQKEILSSSKGGRKEKRTERLICSKERLEDNFQGKKYTINRILSGKELIGLEYDRLFSFVKMDPKEEGKKGWYVTEADFVTMDTGTGIVHIAPSYGADDLLLRERYDLPLLHAVDMEGKFFRETDSLFSGLFFKEADKEIIRELKSRGLVWESSRYRHQYPFGYRTGAPLLYYAKNAWYIRTTQIKEQLIQNNKEIRWVPDHIQNGRFGKWLASNRDWALSRERFWGTPLPIWSDGEGGFRCIGSIRELSLLCEKDLKGLELHRPEVDQIQFQDPKSGRMMSRVPEVVDCWFDSGAMPYAQLGLSVEGLGNGKIPLQDEDHFPADFISEAIDQTRGWFYTLLCIGTMISGKSPYKTAVCLGHVLDEKGEKMSKSKGNTIDPWKAFEIHGADAVRWFFLTGAPPGHSRYMGQLGGSKDPITKVHSFLNMFQNSVNFFLLYAQIDQIRIEPDWEYKAIKGALPFAKRTEMDQWILSVLQELIDEVSSFLEDYDCMKAGKAIESFLDSLSNWYIRRNRRRFWKGALDQDKLSAYDTLYRCLVTVSRLCAPFIPFQAEDSFQALVVEPLCKNQDSTNPKSVLLNGWPQADRTNSYNPRLLQEGDALKEAVFVGRSARMKSGIKIRQPLRCLFLYLDQKELRPVIEKNKRLILEELNIKGIEFLNDSTEIIATKIRPNLPRIGKRLGAKVRLLQEYLNKTSVEEILGLLASEKVLRIPDPSEQQEEEHRERFLTIQKDDLLIESISKEGTSGVKGKGMVAAVDTELNQELIQEGISRELIRNIQSIRKNEGLSVTDRITLYFHDSGAGIAFALESFAKEIEAETLSCILSENPSLSSSHDSSSNDASSKKSIPFAKQEIKIEQESTELWLWLNG